MTNENTESNPSFDQCVQRYELALRDCPPADWYDATIEALDAVQRHCKNKGLAESAIPKRTREHWYTRLATALTEYITAPSTTLTMVQLQAVCRRKQTIAYIFCASGYRDMKHLLPLVGVHEDGDITLPRDRAIVLFAFIGLDDINDTMMAVAVEQTPDVLLTLMLGWLNQRAVLTEQGERNRTALLGSGPAIETAAVTDAHIEQLVNAWMYSSYASAPKKHDIKASFNVLLSTLMQKADIASSPTARVQRARPTMVVIHERFLEQHAMYRCYAPALLLLKERFRLVAIAEEKWIDNASDKIFDEIHRLGEGPQPLRALVKLVQRLEPDIVYYPSLGMLHWTVMLAQLRLAPIQIMTHGHPGTSMSPAIDYVYMCELEGDLGNIHSERVLVGSQYGAFAPHSNLPQELPDLARPSEREVRVAVNSKVMKLSHRLLDICEKLIANAEVPVRFCFFPSERGLYFDGLTAAITARLPEATVFAYVNYEDFLKEMCKCDLALAAFPFGNTNSTVDTCLLNLPTVANFGPESPAQSDRMVMDTAGFPSWLVARSDEEYYEKALQLINDATLRKELTADITRESVRKNLFSRASFDDESDPVADMFWYAYEHHEALQASPRRVIHYKDVLR